LAYRHAHVITTLYAGNQAFQRADGAPEAKLRIIPNGVDLDRFGSGEKPTGLRPTVALIGRVVPIKDVRSFIQAVAQARKAVPTLRALIAGPEEEDAVYVMECKDLAAREGLQDTLEFLGQTDIPKLLPQLDLVALTSISEAMPLVLLEAGAASVPAVATDVGACREILLGRDGDAVSGEGGMIVPVGDTEAMAAAISTLLRDRARTRAMGLLLRRRVDTTYNKQTIDRCYRDVYASLMGQVENLPAPAPALDLAS
jgi:glycosyltransferase involved in cell wall biosynthesis